MEELIKNTKSKFIGKLKSVIIEYNEVQNITPITTVLEAMIDLNKTEEEITEAIEESTIKIETIFNLEDSSLNPIELAEKR